MKRVLTFCVGIAMAGALSPHFAAAGPMDRSAGERPGLANNTAETEVAFDGAVLKTRVQRGSPGYAWVSLHAGNVRMADSMDLTVNYRLDEMRERDINMEQAILDVGAGHSKSIILPDGPEPHGPGNVIGRTDSTRLNCTQAVVNHTPLPADIEYHWEWRNTVDSNGDGKFDSNPQWVLTGIRVTCLPLHDATMCQ